MGQKEPLISIVMPSYNQAEFIEEAIGSVINQTYINFELIIVDGGSTDGTVEILKSYRQNKNISKIIIEKDNGQSEAIQKGFKFAKGEIYNWLNSDDVLQPGALEIIAKNFKENRFNILVGELNIIDEKSNKIGLWKRYKIPIHKWLIYPQLVGQPATFFSSELFSKVGGCDTNLHYAMDYDLYLRFAKISDSVIFIDNTIASFRVHDNSKTIALPYKFWKEELKVFLRHTNSPLINMFYYLKIRSIISTLFGFYIFRFKKW